MEQWIDDLFNQDILQDAANRYHADAKNAKKLGDFENYVFEVYKNEQPYILRLTHSSHRSKEEVEAELQWINYLHTNGVNVSLVHHSENGNLVEEIRVGDTFFFICLFDKAPGKAVSMKGDLFGPELFQLWGAITGKMHRVTKAYQPLLPRERWDKGDLIDIQKYVTSEKDAEIVSETKELIRKIKQLPETKDTFGLIHSDIHPGNFFYHDGELHVFDFDDSCYHYYISDIAIPLYYSVWWKLRNENLAVRSQYGEELLFHFLGGYQQENEVDGEWIKKIPLFLKLRDFDLYTVFHKKWDIESMDADEKQLLDQIRDRLIRHELMVEIDYEKVLQRLESENVNGTN